jgi:hypothetical protein
VRAYLGKDPAPQSAAKDIAIMQHDQSESIAIEDNEPTLASAIEMWPLPPPTSTTLPFFSVSQRKALLNSDTCRSTKSPMVSRISFFVLSHL